MGATTVFVGERNGDSNRVTGFKPELFDSMQRLFGWLEAHEYRGYDTFDGLSSPILRPLTFETRFLRTVLQQGIRRFPWNLRPLAGIGRHASSKGMGFLARAFVRLHQTTGDVIWAEKATCALNWLMENRLPGYSGACWGNHFDYQSRTFYLPKGVPTVVWTSLIGHAFLDAYEHFQKEKYLEIAVSACRHILQDLPIFPDGEGSCIAYIPGQDAQVHNASTLGGSLLARTYMHTGDQACLELATKSMQYTVQYQLPNGAWYYGEKENLHWIDNFHSAYVLDCLLHFQNATGDHRFSSSMLNGYRHWKATFFLPDGTPRYYDRKTLPIDIQCCSQAIDTLVFFRSHDPESLTFAAAVAQWTIQHMQDRSGYFFYRRYSPRLVNKTPTLHWGQATMMCALAGLYQAV